MRPHRRQRRGGHPKRKPVMQTIDRSKAYIDAGADMIFPEGLDSLEEFSLVAQQLRKLAL